MRSVLFKISSVVLLIVAIAVPTVNADVAVSVVSGQARVKTSEANPWAMLNAGVNRLPDNGLLQLAPGCVANVAFGGKTLQLKGPASINLTQITATTNNATQVARGTLTTNVRTLNDNSATRITAVAGVRASLAENAEDQLPFLIEDDADARALEISEKISAKLAKTDSFIEPADKDEVVTTLEGYKGQHRVDLLINLGNVEQALGDYAAAKKTYSELLTLELLPSQRVQASTLYAGLLYDLGEFKAMEEFISPLAKRSWGKADELSILYLAVASAVANKDTRSAQARLAKMVKLDAKSAHTLAAQKLTK